MDYSLEIGFSLDTQRILILIRILYCTVYFLLNSQRKCEHDDCVIQAPSIKKAETKLFKEEAPSNDELRQRKCNPGENGEVWEETTPTEDEQFERKVEQYRKDPLYLLNPLPTLHQRKAQNTIRKSGWYDVYDHCRFSEIRRTLLSTAKNRC